MAVERTEPTKRSYVNIDVDLLYHETLSLEAKMLWCVLRQHAQNGTGVCWPSYKRLQQILRKSENVIRTAMNELVDAEFIERKRRGRGATNIYVFKELRTSESEVQEAKIITFSGSRTSPQEVVEPQNLRGEVLTNEVLPNEIVPTPNKSDKTILQAVCEKLGIKKDIDAEELVERSMASLPDTDHVKRALLCKGYYEDWSKKSEMKRAGHYESFCNTEKNPRERPGYTLKTATSNGGSSPSEYVKWNTPIPASPPKVMSMFEALKASGSCKMELWEQLSRTRITVKDDRFLIEPLDDDAKESLTRSVSKRSIDCACRDVGMEFVIGCDA